MRLNRWTFVAIVLLGVAALASAAGVTGNDIYLVSGTFFVATLTYPTGLVAQLVALPLLYLGIATPAETLALCSPLYALAGYLQWYVFVPRLIRRSSP
jgi:hypothetical protein